MSSAFSSDLVNPPPLPKPHDPSPYNYVPTEWICALLLALFSLTTIIHIGQMFRFRTWWMLPTAVLAGVFEILGWSGRLWSSKNPSSLNAFLMQISTTIIAPTPLLAVNFVLLGRVMKRLGTHYSRLPTKTYLIVFLVCDIIALVVQAIGGGIASTAARQNKNPALGGHIMLGGIVFQMAAIIVYVTLSIEYFVRYNLDRPLARGTVVKRGVPNERLKLQLLGMLLMTVLIFIRSVYRTIELSDGWTGRIIATQVLFNVLDGTMVVLAMFTLNFFHPGFLLRDEDEQFSVNSPRSSEDREDREEKA